jgi:hypothetical protein
VKSGGSSSRWFVFGRHNCPANCFDQRNLADASFLSKGDVAAALNDGMKKRIMWAPTFLTRRAPTPSPSCRCATRLKASTTRNSSMT